MREYVSPYKGKIFLALFFMIIVAGCGAGIVQLVRPAIDDIFIHYDASMLWFLPLSMVSLSTLKGLAEYFQSYLIRVVGQSILNDLQMALYHHLLTADVAYIHSQSSGRLISRFTNDISLMRGAVSTFLAGIAKHLFTIIFMICLMFNLEPFLSFLIFVVFPLSAYPIQKIGRRMRGLSLSTQESLGHYTQRLDETFQSIRLIKSYQSESFERDRAQKLSNNILKLYKKTAKLDALTSPIMEILSGVTIGAMIVYGGHGISNGTTTAGSLFAFISAFASSYRPFKSLMALNLNLQESIAASKRLFDVLDRKPTIYDIANAIDCDFHDKDIEFKDVSLEFDSINSDSTTHHEKVLALKSINLHIESGKTVAIIGESGSGKTSIINSLLRFYDYTSGAIEIGGVNIRDIAISSLRRNIALVTQDTMLFNASIRENIAYNLHDITDADIERAAKMADAHDFIMQLPHGYETVIGSRGCMLSGGQGQRLSIARAFLKNAPVLILDEATSSLDVNTEQNIQSAIESLRKGRTTIIVTHRLHTIANVDHIYVIGHGHVLEHGTHEELLANKQKYCQLLSNYEVGVPLLNA